MQDHPMARMLFTMVKESRKDLRRIPEETIAHLARQLGEAFIWIADGELEEENTDNGS